MKLGKSVWVGKLEKRLTVTMEYKAGIITFTFPIDLFLLKLSYENYQGDWVLNPDSVYSCFDSKDCETATNWKEFPAQFLKWTGILEALEDLLEDTVFDIRNN